MRIVKRFALAITTTLIILTIILILSISTPKQPPLQSRTPPSHDSNSRPYKKPTHPPWTPPRPRPASTRKPTSHLIVKAHLPSEDVTWLTSLAPTWTNALVRLDPRFTRLYAGASRVDKGRVASAYLEWLITHYNNLPPTIIFLGPAHDNAGDDVHETQRHILDLRLPALHDAGYTPIPCPSRAACAHPLRPFARPPPPVLRTLEVSMPEVWRALFNSSSVPTGLAAVPGARFAVSREQVRARAVGEYERLWAWLQETKMDDESAGLVVEGLWPVVFGRGEGVYCPEYGACECVMFGRC
jgi:hypothetical protein